MLFPVEGQFLLGMQQLVVSPPWMRGVAVFCARNLIFFNVLLAGVLLLSKRSRARHAAIEAAWSVGVALLLTTILALCFQRARPYLAMSDIVLLIPPPFNTSFPSGHTASAFALAGALMYGDRVAGVVSLGIALFVACGRLAVGVHFPTDILGGICVGLGSFYLVRMGHMALRRRSLSRASSISTSP